MSRRSGHYTIDGDEKSQMTIEEAYRHRDALIARGAVAEQTHVFQCRVCGAYHTGRWIATERKQRRRRSYGGAWK